MCRQSDAPMMAHATNSAVDCSANSSLSVIIYCHFHKNDYLEEFLESSKSVFFPALNS
jgi:hypothetical protein